MKLEVTKERVLQAAENCPQAKSALRILFPEAFIETPAINLQKGDILVSKTQNKSYLITIDGDKFVRIDYKSGWRDNVIHDYKTLNEYEIKARIIGNDREISSWDKKAMKALLGTDNIEEIKDVYGWLNGTPTYINRRRVSPVLIEERSVRFDVESDRVEFYCNNGPYSKSCTLGFRIGWYDS